VSVLPAGSTSWSLLTRLPDGWGYYDADGPAFLGRSGGDMYHPAPDRAHYRLTPDGWQLIESDLPLVPEPDPAPLPPPDLSCDTPQPDSLVTPWGSP
jgi:hypothetical protein